MTLYGAPGPTLEILIEDPAEHDFASAETLLSDLSGEQATAIPPGAPHSIAEIVAHLLSNARFNLALFDAADPASVRPPLPDWPEVTATGWPRLRQEYFDTLATLQQLAGKEREHMRIIFSATDSEPAWTVGYKLTCSVAKHAAYHMGQIALLRHLLESSEASLTR